MNITRNTVLFWKAEHPGEFRRHVEEQARIEIGFERFLKEKNYQAVVTHFGQLGELKQLPGTCNAETDGKRLWICSRKR